MEEVARMIERQSITPELELAKSRSNISAHSDSFSFTMEEQMEFYEKFDQVNERLKNNLDRLKRISHAKELWRKS